MCNKVHVHIIVNYLYEVDNGVLPEPERFSCELDRERVEKIINIFKKYGTRLRENHYVLTLPSGDVVELFIDSSGVTFLYHAYERKSIYDIEDILHEIEIVEYVYNIHD